jgi:hypothetical protein
MSNDQLSLYDESSWASESEWRSDSDHTSNTWTESIVTHPIELESGMILERGMSYAELFTESGEPTVGLVPDRFGYLTLPHSRGVFLNPIPRSSTLSKICANICGGALERVDFHNLQNRTCVGVFFIAAEDAMNFIKFSRAQGGVYWGGTGILSGVEPIPRVKGGHEIVKPSVGRGIISGATRCLLVIGVLEFITAEILDSLVKAQSRNISVEIQEIRFFVSGGQRCVVVTMGTIGTALGAELMLRSDDNFAECIFDYVRDPCEGALEELAVRWDRERCEDHSRGISIRRSAA